MNNCIDCGKKLSRISVYRRAKRCKSCSMKYRQRRPELHWNYKGGKPKCKFCGNELANYGFDRCQSCAKKEYYKNPTHNPNWQGGKSFEIYPIEFTNELKESIRQRDNYICQNCSMTEEEHLIVIGTILHVHHIDYNKKNYNKDNLITLCIGCNIRANYNRNYWQDLYINKIILAKKVE
jgi:hypothetical protein